MLIKEIVDINSVDVETDEYLAKEFDSDDIMMSSFDKHAIEAALQLQEQDESITVQVLCLGSENALKILREAIAMGIESGNRVEADALDYLSAYAKGKILAKTIKHLGDFDLILTGMYSTDFGQAQLPSLLASNLGLPQITYLNSIKIENNMVIGDRYVESGAVTTEVPIPCVVILVLNAF